MPSEVGIGLARRVVIVTGAGQGIGRVFAHALAKAGAIPLIAELNAERGQTSAFVTGQALTVDGGATHPCYPVCTESAFGLPFTMRMSMPTPNLSAQRQESHAE